jgi:hypothetical protein
MKSIKELKNIHQGKDIYILASGKSVDFINEDFFDDKIIIGVNQAYKKIWCDYLVRKEVKFIKKSLETDSIVIVSEYDSGNLNSGEQKLNTNKTDHENLYYFEHLDNKHTSIDTSVFGTDKIVVSFSTITSAIHIAAYMGAKNIILIGHDCGTIDGEMTFKGYYDSIKDTPWSDWNQYKNWLKVIESQTVLVKEQVRKHYGANVLSLNPFVSFNLENHIYQ